MNIINMCAAGGTLCMFAQLAFYFFQKTRTSIWGNIPAIIAMLLAFVVVVVTDVVVNRGMFLAAAFLGILTSSRFGDNEKEKANVVELVNLVVLYVGVTMVGLALEQY